jgi:DNA-binding GntR family transcriptional regulator
VPVLVEKPLRRTSLRDQALAAIRYALVTGRIVPGVVYSAASLAAELGVSNSPVREAMLALVDDGLMEVVPNRGYRAVALSPADSAEIVQLRLLLEVPAVGMAAQSDLGDRLAELQRLVEVIEQTAADGDVEGNLEADRAFHLMLVGACGNQRLTTLIARLRDQARLHNLRRLAESGALTVSAAEHRQILAAVTRHDRSAAEDLVRAHLAHLTTDWSGAAEPPAASA